MTSRSTADLVRSYLRSLWWQVPLTLCAVLVVWALDVDGMRERGVGPVLVIGVGFFVVLSPLLWLRYEAFGRRDKQLAVLLGLSLVWLVVGTLVMLALLTRVLD